MHRRYPKLAIRSKSEFVRHISGERFPREQAQKLVNRVRSDFDSMWRDNKSRSEPDKGKYVRDAKGTPLDILLRKINEKILIPYDCLLPVYLYGGLAGKSHVQAAVGLLGQKYKHKRTLLKIDIEKFFEQVTEERLVAFLRGKCGCSIKGAKLIAQLCCVPVGPKGSGRQKKTLARGFATSSRLAIWCNLDAFIRVERLIKRRLKGKDPKIAIYVDDIGITAYKVTFEKFTFLSEEIKRLFAERDRNQALPLNLTKMKITPYNKSPEFVGLALERNRIDLGKRPASKLVYTQGLIERVEDPNQKRELIKRRKSLLSYRRFVRKSRLI